MTTLTYPKSETAIVEVVIYKVKPASSDNFEEVLSLARSAIEKFPGFIEYKTLKSRSRNQFIDLVKWDSFDSARTAAQRVKKMQELAPFMAAFEEILIMDHFELFANDTFDHGKKFNLLEEDSTYYQASDEPCVIELKPLNYLSIAGIGAPEEARFINSMEAIYSVAYNLKFTSKAAAQDFIVPKTEAQWWTESGLPLDKTPQAEWFWNILIRLPKFIGTKAVDKAVEEVIRKTNITLASEVLLTTLDEGKCTQVLHVGPNHEDQSTIEKIQHFMDRNTLEPNGHHHKIYITDPYKTQGEMSKTIIRYPVK